MISNAASLCVRNIIFTALMKEKKFIPDISWLLTISAPLSRERRGNPDREKRITIADRDKKPHLQKPCKTGSPLKMGEEELGGKRRAGLLIMPTLTVAAKQKTAP
jgi:hypothetical protein